MKKEDIIKQLLPGVFVGFLLGFFITLLVGADTKNLIPNVIGGVVGCVVPTLLNGIIVLKGTAKILKRKLSLGKALLKNLPYVLIAALIGFVFMYGILYSLLKIDLRTIHTLTNSLIVAVLGVVVSTLLAYFALKCYEKNGK